MMPGHLKLRKNQHMKTNYLHILLVTGLLIIWTTPIFGQVKKGAYEFGILAGMFVYQGDLAPSPIGSYRTAGKDLSLMAERIISNDYGLRATLSFGRLNGNDARFPQPEWRRQRNFRFTSAVWELSALMVWYPRGRDRKLSPFLAAGPGLSLLNIHRDASGVNREYFTADDPVNSGLPTDLAHTPPRLLPVLPLGGGIRYAITDHFHLIAETFYRLSRTDYLDGFSQSAQPSLNDHYMNHSIGIIYSFNKRSGLDCPGNIR